MSKFEEPGCIEEAQERLEELRQIDQDISLAFSAFKSEEAAKENFESDAQFKAWKHRAIVKRRYVAKEIRDLKDWIHRQTSGEEEHRKGEIDRWRKRIEQKLDRVLESLEGRGSE